jgi:peptidyl-prolyl cis-trans isomerase C
MPGGSVAVNGTTIAAHEIAAEMQHHPSPSSETAWEMAARALVVRRLLLDEAARRALVPDAPDDAGRLPEEISIDRLLAEVITVPVADDATCRRWHAANKARFRTPELWEASHILIAADPEDDAARAGAEARAQALLAQVLDDPESLADLARLHSACPSAKDGGHLGQIGRGSTVPEFETFLAALEPGQVCPVVVKSRYGMHVVRLHARAEARELPFEAVRAEVARHLREASWRRAVHQFIAHLAGRARIEGILLDQAATGPLLQ